MIKLFDHGKMTVLENDRSGERRHISAPSDEVQQLLEWITPEYETIVIPGPR